MDEEQFQDLCQKVISRLDSNNEKSSVKDYDSQLYSSDRCLKMYQKYLKEWDKYESRVFHHFDEKEISRYGTQLKSEL